MPRRRKKKKGYKRVTIAVDEEAMKLLDEIADEEDFTRSAVAGMMLEERLKIEEILEAGWTVVIKDPDGQERELSPFRRTKRLFAASE
jgi:ParB-like chromosome segregation protein Spo0J